MKDSQGRWRRNVTMAAGFLKLDRSSFPLFLMYLTFGVSEGIIRPRKPPLGAPGLARYLHSASRSPGHICVFSHW